MRHLRSLGNTAAIAAASAALVAGSAEAAETASAPLTCESGEYIASGFGRGQVLFLAGTTQRFIPSFVQRPTGEVLFEAPGQGAREDLVTCTATSPISNSPLIYQGFFTPRAG